MTVRTFQHVCLMMGVVLAEVVLPSRLYAQSQPALSAATPEPTPAPATPPPAAVDPRTDPAWIAYQSAFEMLAAGRSTEAARALELLILMYPNHPAAADAARLQQHLKSPAPSAPQPQPVQLPATSTRTPADDGAVPHATATPAPDIVKARKTLRLMSDTQRRAMLSEALRHEMPDDSAVAEFAFWHTAAGVFTGIQFCGTIDCTRKGAYGYTAATLGVAALATSAVVASQDEGILPGEAAAWSSSYVWSWLNGLGLIGIMNTTTNRLNQQAGYAIMLGSTAVGFGVGSYLTHDVAPPEGMFDLAGNLAVYGAYSALTVVDLIGDANRIEPLAIGAIVAMADVGLLTAPLIWERYPMTGQRANAIFIGGLAGGLFVASSMYIFTEESNNPTREAYLGYSWLGATVTGAITALATDHWDDDVVLAELMKPDEDASNVDTNPSPRSGLSAPQFSLMPTDNGLMAALTMKVE